MYKYVCPTCGHVVVVAARMQPAYHWAVSFGGFRKHKLVEMETPVLEIAVESKTLGAGEWIRQPARAARPRRKREASR